MEDTGALGGTEGTSHTEAAYKYLHTEKRTHGVSERTNSSHNEKRPWKKTSGFIENLREDYSPKKQTNGEQWKRISKSIGCNRLRISLQDMSPVGLPARGWGGWWISAGFLGLEQGQASKDTWRDRSFGHVANRLIPERFPIGWSAVPHVSHSVSGITIAYLDITRKSFFP